MRRKNILIILSAVFVVVLGFTSTVFAGNNVRVTVDGYEVQFEDQLPVLVDGHVLVPIRHVFDLLGFEVSWDRRARIATLTGDDVVISVPAGGEHLYVNDEMVIPVVPQLLQNGRLLLPVETIAEVVGATVTWDEEARLVVIATEADEPAQEYENVVTEDMLRFKYEYEALNNQPNAAGTIYMKSITIPEFNLIRYTTPEEILEIAESGTGLIYFGFPQCPWCRQMTPLLIETALEKGLDVIHYIDMLPIRSTWALQDGEPVMVDPGHPYYHDLLVAFESVIEPMSLNPFHLVDAEGNRINTEELRIFVPTVVAIRDGEIVASHVYTVPASAPGNLYGNQWNPLSDEETAYLRAIYEELISAMID